MSSPQIPFEELWDFALYDELYEVFHNGRTIPLYIEEDESTLCIIRQSWASNIFEYNEIHKRCQQQLYERVESYTVQFYQNTLLPSLQKHGETITLIEKVHEAWLHCDSVSKHIVKRLEGNFVLDLPDFEEREAQGLQTMIRERFKVCIYHGLSDVLRRVGFSSFTENGQITDQSCLYAIQTLICCIGMNKREFCKSEWDDHVLGFLSTRMGLVAEGWVHCSIQSIIDKTNRQILAYRSIRILDDSKDLIASKFWKAMSEICAKLCFTKCSMG